MLEFVVEIGAVGPGFDVILLGEDEDPVGWGHVDRLLPSVGPGIPVPL